MTRKKIVVDPFVPVQKLTVHKPHEIEVPADPKSEPVREKSSSWFARFRGPKSQLAGIVLAAMVIGLLMPVQILGELVLAVYAVVALVCTVKSTISFILA